MRGTRGRNGKIAPRRRKSRLGSVLFFIGILSVLGTTFVVGALAGRLSVSPGGGAKDADRGAKAAPPIPPTLTFYRELTAPLTTPATPPPPASRPHNDKTAKAETARPDARKRSDSAPAASPALPDTGAAAIPHHADGAGRYTVQVGSYNARAQAESLRARLNAAGYQAYIAEGEANGTTRYRVRVGSFASMEEARQAAVRLGSDARVATYVTTR